MSDDFNMYAPLPPGDSQDLGTAENTNIYTGREFSNQPPAPTPPTPQAVARLYEMAAKQGNTQETMEKVSASFYMANMMGESPAKIFKDFDYYAESYVGMQTPPKDLYKALKDEFVFGMVNQDIGKVGFDMLTASEEDWDEYRRLIDFHKKKLPKMDNVDRGLVGRGLKGTMKLLPQILDSFTERTLTGLGFAAGAAPGIFASGTLLPGLLDESITLMSAFSTGFGIGGWKHAIQQEGGMLVADLATQKDEKGNYYDPKIVKSIGSAYGIFAGAIEKLSVDALIKGFPGAENVVKEAAKKVGIGLAATGGLRQLAGKFALKYGTMIIGESTQEMTQEALQIIGEYYATILNNDMHDTGFETATVAQSMDRLGTIFRDSAETFGVMGLLGSVTRTFQKPNETVQAIKDMTPEQVADFAERIGLRTEEDSVLEEDEGVRSADDNIEKLNNSIAELRESGVENAEELIKRHEETITRLEEYKNRIKETGRKPSWAKGLREYASSRGLSDTLDPTHPVRAQIRESFTNMDETQLDVAMLLLGSRAQTVGMDIIDYVGNNIRFATKDEAAGVISDPDGSWRGATWFEASKSIIAASETSDFSTFIHEIGHHLTTQVIGRKDIAVLKKQFGVKEEDGKLVWTEDGQERFAELFEKWFREGTAPSREMAPIFKAVRNLLSQIINVLRPRLNKNVTTVFENLFQQNIEKEENIEMSAPHGVYYQKAATRYYKGNGDPAKELILDAETEVSDSDIQKIEDAIRRVGLPEKVLSQDGYESVDEFIESISMGDISFQEAWAILESSLYPVMGRGAADELMDDIFREAGYDIIVIPVDGEDWTNPIEFEERMLNDNTFGVDVGTMSEVAPMEELNRLPLRNAVKSDMGWLVDTEVGELRKKYLNGDIKFRFKLNEIIDAKELFEKYPIMKDVVVVLYPSESTEAVFGAFIDSVFPRIELMLTNGSKSTLLPTLAHEIQHAIQSARGDNLSVARGTTRPIYRNETLTVKHFADIYQNIYLGLFNGNEAASIDDVINKFLEEFPIEGDRQPTIQDWIKATDEEKEDYTSFVKEIEWLIGVSKGSRRAEVEQYLKDRSVNERADAEEMVAYRLNPSEVQARMSEADRAIYYQKASEHKQLVKDATAKGLPVPKQVLMYYYREKWARDALQKYELQEERGRSFQELYSTVRQFDSWKEFKEYAEQNWGKEVTKGVSDAWYKSMYKEAHTQEILQPAKANKIFIDSINSIQGLKDYLNAVQFDESLESAILQKLTEGEIDETVVKNAVKTMRKNPQKYRELHALSTNDTMELKQLKEEKDLEDINEAYSRQIKALENFDPEAEIIRLSATVDNITTRAKLIAGKMSEAKIAEEIDTLQGKIATLKEKENKAEEKAKANSEALESAREEAKQQGKDKDEEIKILEDAIKSAKKEAKMNSDLIKKQNAERQRLRRIRESMLKLARQITKPVSDSVHVEQKIMIEAIQAHIDPNFRSENTIARWNVARNYINNNPEAAKDMSKKTINRINKVPLNFFTLDELKEIKATIDNIAEEGRAKIRAIKVSRASRAKKLANDITESLREGYDRKIFKKEEIDVPKSGPKSSMAKKYFYTFMRPSRIFDLLDGGKDFSGPIHRAFVDAVNKAEDTAMRNKRLRHDALEERRVELGIKDTEFAKRYKLEGSIFTLDQIMDIYAKWKNDRARAVLMAKAGMNITEERYTALVANLEEKHIKFVDAVLADYEANYDGFRDAVIKMTNKDPGYEPYYTPIFKTGAYSKDNPDQITSEMELRAGLKKASVKARAAYERIDIPDQFQKPIRLGLYSSWDEAVAEQEHYKSYAELVLDLRTAFHKSEVQAMIGTMYGGEIINEVDKYLGRIANPNIYKSFSTANEMARFARAHVATAYLAYNIVTTMKQFISLAYYTAAAGPHYIIGAIFETAMNWEETRAFVEEMSPQMKERPIYRVMQEMLAGNKEGIPGPLTKLGNKGMQILAIADAITTTIGYKAVFNANVEKYGADEAARRALNATLRTQPAAGAKDIPSVYAEDNMITLLLQFTNQVNNIWNMVSYDMPAAIRQRQFGQFAGNFLGLAVGSILMYMLTTRSLPNEDDENAIVYTRNAFMTQLFSSIPIVGPVVVAGYKGYETDLSVVTPFKASARLAQKINKIMNGEELGDAELRNLIDQTWEGIAIASGAPYVAVKRGVNAFSDIAEGDVFGAFQEVVLGKEIEED